MQEQPIAMRWAAKMESGDDLSSRAVSSQVLSTLKGLTSVFGMGTGGTPSPLSPEIGWRFALLFLLRAPSKPHTASLLRVHRVPLGAFRFRFFRAAFAFS